MLGFRPVILGLITGICILAVSIDLIVTSPLLLVDGAFLGAMSRAVGPDPPPHWSRSVLSRTWLAALVTAVVFGLVGSGSNVSSRARTVAEAWAADRSSR